MFASTRRFQFVQAWSHSWFRPLFSDLNTPSLGFKSLPTMPLYGVMKKMKYKMIVIKFELFRQEVLASRAYRRSMIVLILLHLLLLVKWNIQWHCSRTCRQELQSAEACLQAHLPSCVKDACVWRWNLMLCVLMLDGRTSIKTRTKVANKRERSRDDMSAKMCICCDDVMLVAARWHGRKHNTDRSGQQDGKIWASQIRWDD